MKIQYSLFSVVSILSCLLLLPVLSEAQTDPDDHLQELETNRAKWDSLGLDNYEFNYLAQSNLPAPFSSTLLVRVYQNQVARILLSNGQDVTAQVQAMSQADGRSFIPTISDIFERLEAQLLAQPFSYTVRYSSQEDDGYAGYPMSVNINPVQMLADDEILWTISNVFALDELPVGDTREQDALSAARVLWQSQTTLDLYAFSYERSCYCIEEYRGPWMVRVQGDVIMNVETRAEGTVPLPDVQKYIPTIDKLFDEIQNGIELNAAEIRVTYNEILGYPESVYIDYNAGIADEEFSAQVDYFAPVGSWQSALDQGKQKWEMQGVQSYTYLYYQDTQDVDNAGSKLVEVLDGIVVSVNGEPVKAIARSSFSEIPTMDDLFSRIQQAIDMDAFAVRVAYDEETGYPLDIHIDYDDRIVDDEWIAKATYPLLEKDLSETEVLETKVSETEFATEPPVTMAPTAAATDEADSVRGADAGVSMDSGVSMLTISTCLGRLSWMAMILMV